MNEFVFEKPLPKEYWPVSNITFPIKIFERAGYRDGSVRISRDGGINIWAGTLADAPHGFGSSFTVYLAAKNGTEVEKTDKLLDRVGVLLAKQEEDSRALRELNALLEESAQKTGMVVEKLEAKQTEDAKTIRRLETKQEEDSALIQMLLAQNKRILRIIDSHEDDIEEIGRMAHSRASE